MLCVLAALPTQLLYTATLTLFAQVEMRNETKSRDMQSTEV